MKRKTFVGVAVLVALAGLLLAADTAGWWFITNRMEQEVATWRQAQAAAGAVVVTGPARRGGWPFQADLLLPAVTLATDGPGQPDAIVWQCDQVRLVYAPWRPSVLDVLVEAPQIVRFGTAPPVELATGRLDVQVPLDGAGQAEGVSVSAWDAVVPLASGPVRIDSLGIRLRPTDAFVSASGITLTGRSLPFGGTVQSLDLHARSTGPVPLLRDPAAAVAAWREQGSRLLIDDLALRWGSLDLRGHASLGLDGAMQPEGTAAIQLTGFTEVIEALARSGAITRNDARVATTLLGLMSRPGTNDVAEADLPLTLRDRTLSVGAIPLLRVPVLSVP